MAIIESYRIAVSLLREYFRWFLAGIREMFVNQFGYVLSDLSCQDEDRGTPREARPINLEIYKITEAYHGVEKLCDSGRSRRYAAGKLNYAVNPRLLCRGSMRILLCANIRPGDIAAG